MERRVQFFFFVFSCFIFRFRCRCDRPSSINSDCKTTTRTGVPLDTCINNTRHSVFFQLADWFLYFSVLCRPENFSASLETGISMGFCTTKMNILGELVNLACTSVFYVLKPPTRFVRHVTITPRRRLIDRNFNSIRACLRSNVTNFTKVFEHFENYKLSGTILHEQCKRFESFISVTMR